VESFDSGNVNREEHMKETVEAARFPMVELKALGRLAPATSYPAKQSTTWKARVTFHGVSQDYELPVDVTLESAARVHALAHFTLSVEAFKIERPSLMFVKIDDGLTIDADVVFAEQKQ
jgi:hypothetical protein